MIETHLHIYVSVAAWSFRIGSSWTLRYSIHVQDMKVGWFNIRAKTFRSY